MVEWKKLGDVASYYRGVTYNKKQEVPSGGTKILRANNITVNTNKLNFDDVKEISSSVKIKDNQWLYTNDILICAGSGSKEHIGKVAFIDKDINYAYGGFMGKLVSSASLNPRYFFHYMSSSMFKEYLDVALNSTTINNLNASILNDFLIPVPSLAEQERIVGILDTFTASIDNLKEQIAQRRKQYEHYRDQLLDLEGKPGVEMKKLGEICEIKGRIGFRGYTREDQVAKGEGAISLSPGNIEDGKMCYSGCTYITWKKYNESPEIMTFNGDILFCKTGSTVGKVAMVENLPCEATINPQLVVLKRISINSKFLKYSLGTFRIQSIVKKLAGVGSVPNISQEKLGNLAILLPSLSEQERIVSILDTFEASIANLEAQLAQRQKQYEYYRNKLLTFE